MPSLSNDTAYKRLFSIVNQNLTEQLIVRSYEHFRRLILKSKVRFYGANFIRRSQPKLLKVTDLLVASIPLSQAEKQDLISQVIKELNISVQSILGVPLDPSELIGRAGRQAGSVNLANVQQLKELLEFVEQKQYKIQLHDQVLNSRTEQAAESGDICDRLWADLRRESEEKEHGDKLKLRQASSIPSLSSMEQVHGRQFLRTKMEMSPLRKNLRLQKSKASKLRASKVLSPARLKRTQKKMGSAEQKQLCSRLAEMRQRLKELDRVNRDIRKQVQAEPRMTFQFSQQASGEIEEQLIEQFESKQQFRKNLIRALILQLPDYQRILSRVINLKRLRY